MNIKDLSKAIQDYIEDGCTYIAIYKEGRSWDYEILNSDSEDELQNDEELKRLYAIDKNVVVVNGYNDNFGTNSLSDIEYRIKHNYENGIGQIYFVSYYNTENVKTSEIYGNKLTKGEIIKNTIEKNGFFINTDNIPFDLDGKGMAEYLKSIGFNIIRYFDTGRNGLVLTQEGIQVSTNGYCSIRLNIKFINKFDSSDYKLIEGVTKINKHGADLMIYKGEECVKVLDAFYYRYEVAK